MREPDAPHPGRPPEGDDELVRALADFVDDLIAGLGLDLDQLGAEGQADAGPADAGG